MARLSDIIESFIKEMLDENDENGLQIQRNELANYFSCAPSQINYVLTTRFTSDRGYYIESKRGGGGCIVIKRITNYSDKSFIDILNDKIGNNITYDGASMIIDGLKDSEVINDREAILMKTALSDRTLFMVQDNRNALRAEILKKLIMSILL